MFRNHEEDSNLQFVHAFVHPLPKKLQVCYFCLHRRYFSFFIAVYQLLFELKMRKGKDTVIVPLH